MTDSQGKPTPGAMGAACEIIKAFYEKDLDRGFGQSPPRMLLTLEELARIIDLHYGGTR